MIDQRWKAEPQSGGGEFGAQTQTLRRSAGTRAASKNAPYAPLGLVAPAIRAGLFIDHFHGEAAAVRTRKPVLESEVQDLLALGIDQSQAFPAIIEAADVLAGHRHTCSVPSGEGRGIGDDHQACARVQSLHCAGGEVEVHAIDEPDAGQIERLAGREVAQFQKLEFVGQRRTHGTGRRIKMDLGDSQPALRGAGVAGVGELVGGLAPGIEQRERFAAG